jgi:hypothetical protein
VSPMPASETATQATVKGKGVRSTQGKAATAITVAALLVSLIVYIWPRQADPVPTPPPQARSGSIEVLFNSTTTLYPDQGRLPGGAPPRYPASEQQGHCDEWQKWAEDSKIAFIGRAFDIAVKASVTSPMTIRDVVVRIVSKKPIVGSQGIRCQYGAGGLMGTNIHLNLDAPPRRLPMDIDGDGEPESTIPGGIFVVDTAKSESLTTVLSGTLGYVYELTMELVVTENGEEKKIELATPERPIRIVPNYLEFQYFDWDLTADKWTPASG